MTCSQLSRITTAALPFSRSSNAGSPPVTPEAAINASTTSSAVVVVSSRASHTPPAPTSPADRRADRDRERRLADAARPHDLDEPSTREQLGERCQLGLPADEFHRHRRQVARRRLERSGRARADVQGVAVRQDLLLELLELRAGVEAEFVRQLAPDALVGRQRVGLASGPIQRGDQQLPQALLERMARDRRFQVDDHVADVAEPQPRCELDLEQRHPYLFELRPVRFDPVAGGRLQDVASVHR